ncbi:MAG: hypothetical protein EA399_17725 [Desulfovibrionales bacterium]|nr:MAG: hypothetical protein EA399_17725 [Desulfovibrionales bacterium]
MKVQGHVVIGHEFFRKSVMDYQDWRWALVREFLQNSIDAKSTAIDITLTSGGMKVADNGIGMDDDVLLNKLLRLGGSGKNFQDAVGGFGKAKEILYFLHKSYSIRTRSFFLRGKGSAFELQSGLPRVPGVVSEIAFQDEFKLAEAHVMEYVRHVSFAGRITLNGQALDTDAALGRCIRKGDWFSLHHAHANAREKLAGRFVVRVRGVPMFVHRLNTGKAVIMELSGSSEVLSSSRDGLMAEKTGEMYAMLRDLNTNPRTFLRQRAVSVDYFKGLDGPNMVVDGRKAVMPAMQALPEYIQQYLERVEPSARCLRTLLSERERRQVMTDMESRPAVQSILGRYNVHSRADIRNDFVIQNLTSQKLHKKFFPSSFSEQVRILFLAICLRTLPDAPGPASSEPGWTAALWPHDHVQRSATRKYFPLHPAPHGAPPAQHHRCSGQDGALGVCPRKVIPTANQMEYIFFSHPLR